MEFDFGTKLKTLRIQAGLTQKQLAEQIGVTKSVVSFYELRERAPSPEVLIKLAAVFHVTSDYLLGIESERTIDISGLNDEDEQAVRLIVEQLRKKHSYV
ncbi:MAG: helix-turn-helix transcriptional regulator [Ruminococcaceae bacterium]|nr:helix-turn-helix transcriptional regulator [Oscillospiraceae bacterium]